LMNFKPAIWAQKFYSIYKDNFDFLNFVLIPGKRDGTYHGKIKNDISGIGLSIFNSSSFYGSSGRLKGYNVFPLSSYFDTADRFFSYETAHQWINFLQNTPLASGMPDWPKGDIAINVMGPGAGQRYPYTFTSNGQGGYVVGPANSNNQTLFNSMELYLMGLVPPSAVGTFFVLNNQNQSISQGQTLQPSEITLVSVNDVVGAAGARNPDNTTSQKAFRVATIILSEDMLDGYAMSLYDWFARRAEGRQQLACNGYTCNPFYLATGGRGRMITSLKSNGGELIDLDGDHKNEIIVRRPDAGIWYSLPSSTPGAYNSTQWGLPTDVPATGDYDGDGKTDLAVWRPSTGIWYVLPSGDPGTYTTQQWGTSTDMPFPRDYDGDGKTDIAVWRPGTGAWFILPSTTPGSYTSTQWGTAGDISVPGDYDGDVKADIAVWRPGTGVWYVLLSSSPGSYVSTQWGLASDKPVPADYDGDGKTDIAVWRPGSGVWYIRPSNAGGYAATSWGTSGDTPVSGDYDGDGKSDIAVWRSSNGIWYVQPSASPGSYTSQQWGMSGDMPISSLTGILNSIP
jgi:hypothetical protein